MSKMSKLQNQKSSKSMSLSRETIRALSNSELAAVMGGVSQTDPRSAPPPPPPTKLAADQGTVGNVIDKCDSEE